MNPLKLLLLYFFIQVFCTTRCVAQNLIAIKDSAISFSATLPPDSINLTPLDSSFKAHKDREFNFGITNNYCYLLVKLQADSVLNGYTVSLDNTSLDSVLIYWLSMEGTKKLLYKGGNHVKYDSKRTYLWHTAPVLITQEPRYYLVVIKDQAKNVNVAYQLLKEEDLRNRYSTFDRIIYFYLGVVSLIILASLIGYALFRKSELLIFPFYILMATTWILAHYGYLYPNLYTLAVSVSEIVKPVAFLLGAFFLLWLMSQMFWEELKGTLISRLLNSFKLLNLSLCCMGFIYLLLPFPTSLFTVYNITWNFAVLFSIGVILITLTWLFKKSKLARLFFVAISLLLGMALFQVLANIGAFHSSFLTDHGVLGGSLLQIMMLTYGIFYSIWEDKKLKDQQLLQLEEEQTKALQMLLQVQDNERKRIAEDLHDSIGPMLAAIKINFLRMVKAKAEKIVSEDLVAKTESIIDDSITEIRNVSHQLMPKNLSSKGLITVLTDYFSDLQEVYNTVIQFTHELSTSLDKEVQLNLYRIISELVLNAARHSCSKMIEITFKTSTSELLIQIQDQGNGFDPAHKYSTSLGLKNIGSRVAYLKGTLVIESNKGTGTCIKIVIPQREEAL